MSGKETFRDNELLKHGIGYLREYIQYCRNLDFSQTPNYEYLKNQAISFMTSDQLKTEFWKVLSKMRVSEFMEINYDQN